MISQISSSLFTARTFASSSVTNVQKIASSIFSFSRIPALPRMNLIGRVFLGFGGTALLVIAFISAVEYFFPSVRPGLGDHRDDGVPRGPIDGADEEELPPPPDADPDVDELPPPADAPPAPFRDPDADAEDDIASWIRIGTPRAPLDTPRPGV